MHTTKARTYSPRFPNDHYLDPAFVGAYQLEDELGSGGYGFVMTARHRTEGYEVAVKFIIKAKVPDNAWMDDEILGRVPTEVLLLTLISHENIVKCIDVYEDELYFYLIQELHGTPWTSRKRSCNRISAPGKLVPPMSSLPDLSPSPSPSPSDAALDSDFPDTPPQSSVHLPPCNQAHIPSQAPPSSPLNVYKAPVPLPMTTPSVHGNHLEVARPKFSRRASHDLFECIEQSKHKRLSETQARYIFAQVVEAVWYLDKQGITHRDIKDENLVVDKEFKARRLCIAYRLSLIDFGSAVVADPTRQRPFYNLFYGTTAYAASEILHKKPYQAAPAEIWTLGVLLSYLLTGNSPFPTEQDAMQGKIVLANGSNNGQEKGKLWISDGCLGLMRRCLQKDPERRATIDEVREHWWVRGAWEAWEGRVRR
ncbi:Pkinase-domain-containing protein [Heliocybe sulcata]|uniref:Pkinase-domain-containing protein n=1 Tax=Heliocybe sulcata TaxID=5364 RepID=A0A5C3NAY4_9AGAM|nr:Pkinase-domain-containing protein [Heliocybe sulcata]